MFLDDPLQHLWGAAVVPYTFGIDDRDRSCAADAQAADLAPQDPRLAAQSQLSQPPFEEIPRGDPGRAVAAFGLFRIGAKEDVVAGGKASQLAQRG